METPKDVKKKLSYEDFVKLAIVKLRKEGKKAIHSVYSGFNNAFKTYYATRDAKGDIVKDTFGKPVCEINPVDITNALAKEGKIDLRPTKGGVTLYLKGEMKGDVATEVLKTMGV